MFKILLVLLLMTTPAWATQWRAGTGENSILGTSNAADIDYNSYNSIVKPLDNLLSTYCNEYLQYASSTTLTVHSGSVVVSNSQGTIRLMLQDTGATTLTSANLDTGAFVSGTTYYVYATAVTNSSTSSTYYISASNTAPSGQTYYYQIGSFVTDSSNRITNITNNNFNYGFHTSTSKTSGVTYQALTDGIVVAGVVAASSGAQINFYSDSSPSPSTEIGRFKILNASSGWGGSITAPVRKGDYYTLTVTQGSADFYYFIPCGN